jgi:hypothetical protein
MLSHNYHDANLLEIRIGPRKECILTFVLCPCLNPNNPRVAVRFGGVFNFDSISHFLQRIESENRPINAYLAQCDSLHFDEKRISKVGDNFLLLRLDKFGAIEIHCKNISETDLTTD